MYKIRGRRKFEKDLKGVKKGGFDICLVRDIIKKVGGGEGLGEKNRDEEVWGDYGGCGEWEIRGDWLVM